MFETCVSLISGHIHKIVASVHTFPFVRETNSSLSKLSYLFGILTNLIEKRKKTHNILENLGTLQLFPWFFDNGTRLDVAVIFTGESSFNILMRLRCRRRCQHLLWWAVNLHVPFFSPPPCRHVEWSLWHTSCVLGVLNLVNFFGRVLLVQTQWSQGCLLCWGAIIITGSWGWGSTIAFL